MHRTDGRCQVKSDRGSEEGSDQGNDGNIDIECMGYDMMYAMYQVPGYVSDMMYDIECIGYDMIIRIRMKLYQVSGYVSGASG